MKNIKRFLKRFLAGLTLCFLIFAVVNAGIYLVGMIMNQNGIQEMNSGGTPSLLVQKTAEALTQTKEGGYSLTDNMQGELRGRKAWAMLLDSSGRVVWQMDLPTGIPTTYTSADIAEFSRYYLKGYPVYCWEHSGGVMVLGFPKNSYLKYPTDYAYDQFWSMIHWAEILLGCNIALLILLYAFLSWRTVKPIQPILEGLDLLSHGEEAELQENGLFAEIAHKINAASVLLQTRDKALKAKEKARTEWISGVSHDIRTPLSMILGYAGEMADDASLPEPVKTQCGMICAQAVKLRNLVSDLNLVSKLDYSMQPINSRPLRAAKLVREAVTEYLNGGVDEKFEFEIDVTDETVKINGDERLLKRAVANLLQNSVAHNPGGCTITTSLRTDQGNCVITISDSGAGIAPEHLEELRKLMNADREPGMIREHGLGLRIVNSIAKAHSGVFRLESQLGKGTTVALLLPVVP